MILCIHRIWHSAYLTVDLLYLVILIRKEFFTGPLGPLRSVVGSSLDEFWPSEIHLLSGKFKNHPCRVPRVAS